MSKISLITVTLFSILKINSQTTFQWAKNMGGPSADRAYAIATDASGNVYTTGSFQGTSDFDPGVGIFNLTSTGSNDIFISKLDANGNFLWAKTIGSAGSDVGKGINIDGTGNINITGSFQGTVDFDPNTGTTNLTSFGSNDIFVLKLSPAGNLVWAKNMGGSSDDVGYSISADASGNVFTSGYFMSTADFDPAGTTYALNASGGNQDGFISKLDASGNFVWAKQIRGTGSSQQVFVNSITLDGAGNICVGGSFIGTVDFDPSATSSTITALNMDIYIIKLDASGNLIWTKTMGGVSGSNTANKVAVDAANNIYATGYFDQTTDFDPSVSAFTMTSAGAIDTYVLKLDASGNFVWAKRMGSSSSDEGKSIVISSAGEVYTTGYYSNNADFDPGVGTYTLSTIGGTGIFISKLDASGNFAFANGIGYAGASGYDISVSPFFDIYATGNFSQITDFDPSAGTYTLNSNGGGGSDDVFVLKLGQTACPTFSVNSSTSSFTLMCAITSQTLNAINTNSTASVTYTWTAPSSATTTGSSYVVTSAGVYTVSASAPSTTCIVTQTLAIIQTTGNVAFTINTTGSTCNNNGTATVSVTSGTAPFTYTWSTGSNTTTASSLAPGTYSLTVKDANQCTKTNTFSVINAAASFSSVPLCFVTVDSLSQFNVITWEKTLFPTADSFFVYRETSSNVYQLIKALPYSAFSQVTDTFRTMYFPSTGDPNIGTYRYKLMTRDSCGNYSTYSPYHNTIFIVNTSGTFSWPQPYSIEGQANPVSSYVLERDNLSNGTWTTIGSVAGTQSFVIDPAYTTYQSTASWRVRTLWSITCTPSQKSSSFNSKSYSNRLKYNTIGIKENSLDTYFIISPNPSSGLFNIQTALQDIYDVIVYNNIGQLVKQNTNLKGNYTFDLFGFAKGIYSIVIKTNGNYKTIKIVID
ncbi:MAG: T9SS type A sorting domain-containing protein [Bacteroidetes bacterium]|nr:T9SS type A sorting domain-containing protein [Bacteroidota bacterium]